MPYTLQQLSDLEEIRLLKHRYYRGIDTADEKLLSSLLAEDVTVEYRGGSYRVNVAGREKTVNFLMDSFNSDSLAMHHGHMSEIEFQGENEATGLWALDDLFISLERKDVTTGSAIYRDRYVRINGEWKIAATEYDRIVEIVEPLRADVQITTHYLANVGRKPQQRGDQSDTLTWITKSD